MATPTAERQRRWRETMRARGLTPITVWVPENAVPEMTLLAEKLCACADYAPGPIRNVRTGKLVSLAHA